MAVTAAVWIPVEDMMADQIRGKAGTAERATLTPRTRAQESTLATWIIEAPGQSPAWSHYMASVIHLRPIGGVKPAHIRISGATHELILCALDSFHNPIATDQETWYPLMPCNAECQFIVNSDADAIRLGEAAVRAIVDGYMPAEPPFPHHGQRVWQECVDATAEHIRTGGMHPSAAVTRN